MFIIQNIINQEIELKKKINDYRKSLLSTIEQKVKMAVNLNDSSILDEILNVEPCKYINQDQREKHVFGILSDEFFYFDKGLDLLKYLIYEYKISEDNSINLIKDDIKKTIESMFEVRKLNEELKFNLENNEYIKKKIKV